MANETMTVNRLPALTWNWLKMNESKLKEIEAGDTWDVKEVAGESEEIAGLTKGTAENQEVFSNLPEDAYDFLTVMAGIRNLRLIKQEVQSKGGGFDMCKAIKEMAGSQAIMIKSSPKSEGGSEPVRLHFSCEDNKKSFQKVEILAKEGEEVNVLMDYTSPEKTSSGLAAIQTKLHIEKGAKVRLVQVQLLGNEYTLLNDIGAQCEDGAQFEVLQLFLGSSKTYSGCQADLLGKESHFKADIGYQGKGSQRYDMNYVAVHKGKKTVSEMNADGILDDQAFKLFRGTIDFKNGSSGSKGDEKEDVLLMGDYVVNQTIPLILCAEEDVEGNHGASIGQLDEEMLFYLSSRGMSAESASKMIARARMDAVCQKIGDEQLEKLVQDYLEEE